MLKESVRVFPRFSVKKEVFFPEKKKKKALAVLFSPKVVGVFTNNKKRERERCLLASE